MIKPVISLPPLDEVARHWHEAEPIIRRATSRNGSYEPVDILALAFAGRMGIWFIRLDKELIAVAVTEVKQYPRNRILQVEFLAGRFMRSWINSLKSTLAIYARDNNCVSMQAFGRPGWARATCSQEVGSIIEHPII